MKNYVLGSSHVSGMDLIIRASFLLVSRDSGVRLLNPGHIDRADGRQAQKKMYMKTLGCMPRKLTVLMPRAYGSGGLGSELWVPMSRGFQYTVFGNPTRLSRCCCYAKCSSKNFSLYMKSFGYSNARLHLASQNNVMNEYERLAMSILGMVWLCLAWSSWSFRRSPLKRER